MSYNCDLPNGFRSCTYVDFDLSYDSNVFKGSRSCILISILYIEFAQVKAHANVNATNDQVAPPRRPLDYAAAGRSHGMLQMLIRAKAKGLCRKGEKGGFVARDGGKGQG